MEEKSARVESTESAADLKNQNTLQCDFRISDSMRPLIVFCLVLAFGLFAIPAFESLAQDRAPGSVSTEEYRCMHCRNINPGGAPRCFRCGYILIYSDSDVDAKDLKKQLELQAKFRLFMAWGIIVVINLLVIFITSLVVYLIVGANKASRIKRERELESSQAAALNPGPAKIAASPFASRKPQVE